MNYTFFAQTDQGLCRKNNEDAVVFDVSTGVCVLADGMGGYNAGEVASGMATALIQKDLVSWLQDPASRDEEADIASAMEMSVDAANSAILTSATMHAHYAGMGTTLVVGVFAGPRLILGHVGDSRCYRLRGEEFVQITKDHSFLQEQIDAGWLTPEQAATAPNRNLVTRALGVEELVLLDVNEFEVESGDLFLMCSDGLSDMLDDKQIVKLLSPHISLESAAANLVDAANAAGGRDNITVLLAKAVEVKDKRGLISKLLGR